MSGRAVRAWCAGAALVSCLWAVGAHAAPDGPGNVEGVVMTVEGKDVIVDIGEARGLSVGDRLELWRPLEVVHPVTKKRIRDRYRVGQLLVVQIRERMAVTTVQGELARPPEAGDGVVWRRRVEPARAPRALAAAPAPAPRAPAAAPIAAGSPAVPTQAPVSDEAARKVSELIERVKDTTLLERIRAYVTFIQSDPKGPYAELLRADAVQYHRLLRASSESRAPAAVAAGPVAPPHPAPTASIDPPESAVAGRAMEIAVQIDGDVEGAVLHVRSPGQTGYRSTPMARAGVGFYRGTIAGAQVRPPSVEYFVEAVEAEGGSVEVAGAVDAPLRLGVEREADAAPEKLQRETTVSLLTDYADFNRLRRDDWTWQTEGTLGMRFADRGMRALRTGFGVYRGEGGSIEDLDALGLEPRSVGLTYGYLEGEYAFTESIALILRGVTGLTEEGITGGVLGLARIGDDRGTNLAIGGEFLGGVGLRSIAQLEIRFMPRVPVLLRSEVSNQPAGVAVSASASPTTSESEGDLGLRSIAQIGYEIVPRFVVSLRGSYQGRTIRHAGPGVGGAVTTSW